MIGLIGPELYPLSKLVKDMRPTVQTSEYIRDMGPFFVGRAPSTSRRSPSRPGPKTPDTDAACAIMHGHRRETVDAGAARRVDRQEELT